MGKCEECPKRKRPVSKFLLLYISDEIAIKESLLNDR